MNNTLRKITIAGLICVLILLCSLSFKEKKNIQKDDIYIYYTGDIHCAITENIGYSSLSAFIKKEKEKNKHVSLIDLGDFLQDNAKNSNKDNSISSLTKGKAIIEIMNTVGYDIVTIGNHEFDFGLKAMNDALHLLKSQITLCNFKYLGNESNYYDYIEDYIVKDYDGTKVGFIGVISPETSYKCDKSIMKDINNKDLFYFYYGDNGSNLYKRVQEIVNSIQNETDYIVLLSHLGSDNKEGYSSIDLIQNTYGIDVVLDSHSHDVIEEDNIRNLFHKNVILSSSGKSLNNIGKLLLSKEHKIKTSLIKGHDNKGNPVIMDDDNDVVKVIQKIHNDVYGIEE